MINKKRSKMVCSDVYKFKDQVSLLVFSWSSQLYHWNNRYFLEVFLLGLVFVEKCLLCPKSSIRWRDPDKERLIMILWNNTRIRHTFGTKENDGGGRYESFSISLMMRICSRVTGSVFDTDNPGSSWRRPRITWPIFRKKRPTVQIIWNTVLKRMNIELN